MAVDSLLRRAVETWGAEAQLRMVSEECSELSAAINRYLRERCTAKELAEEIADVEIMCAQARMIIGDDVVEEAKRQKLWRLAGRVERAEKERGR